MRPRRAIPNAAITMAQAEAQLVQALGMSSPAVLASLTVDELLRRHHVSAKTAEYHLVMARQALAGAPG